jgi:hypothetical protein
MEAARFLLKVGRIVQVSEDTAASASGMPLRRSVTAIRMSAILESSNR